MKDSARNIAVIWTLTVFVTIFVTDKYSPQTGCYWGRC